MGGGSGRRAGSAVGWSSSDNPHRLADQSVENRHRREKRQMEKPRRHPGVGKKGQREGKKTVRFWCYFTSTHTRVIAFTLRVGVG